MPVLYGINAVMEALKADPARVERVSIQRGLAGPRIQAIIDLARHAGAPLVFEDRAWLDRKAGGGRQGTVLAFGVPDQPVYVIEYEAFFRKNANLVACVTPKWSEYLAISRDVFLESRDELESFVTHRFPVREAAKAFEMYERHEDGIIKVLIDMSDW